MSDDSVTTWQSPAFTTEQREQRQLDIQQYKFVLRHIEREENLVNRRIAWMLTFQGFLFATIALLANKDVDPSLRTNLEALSSIAGLLVSLLACIGVNAAYSSIGTKLDDWDARKRELPPELRRSLPEITSRGASRGGKLLSYGLPFVFVLIWGALLLQQFGVLQLLTPR